LCTTEKWKLPVCCKIFHTGTSLGILYLGIYIVDEIMWLAYRQWGWKRLENNKRVQKRRRQVYILYYTVYYTHIQSGPTPIAIPPYLSDTRKMREHGDSAGIFTYYLLYMMATVRKLLKILVEFFWTDTPSAALLSTGSPVYK